MLTAVGLRGMGSGSQCETFCRLSAGPQFKGERSSVRPRCPGGSGHAGGEGYSVAQKVTEALVSLVVVGFSEIAQLVEHLLEEQRVVGSIPTPGAKNAQALAGVM